MVVAQCGIPSSAAPADRSGPPVTETPSLPPPLVVFATHTPSPSPSAMPTETASPTLPPTATWTASPLPAAVVTATSAAVATAAPTAAVPTLPTATTAPPPTNTAAPPAPFAAHAYPPPQIISNYLAWYDQGSWSHACTSDSPATGAYNSDDSGTISRHIAYAQQAGLDGFTVHWGGVGDRTDRNLAMLLSLAGGTLRSTVTFLGHFIYGTPTQATVVGQLQYLISTYGSSFLQIHGKPVILFSDMPRVAVEAGQTPQQAWAAIRAQVDPAHNTLWIAEGLDPTYLDTFDGIYVYKIDHACCPNAYQNAGRWAGWARQYEAKTGQPRYFIGTIQPGWNDLNSANPGCYGNRIPSDTFARDRENGAYFQRTYDAVVSAQPDMLLVHSFNEWVEGSHIEPSVNFGDFYLNMTAQLAAAFRASR